MPTFSMRSYERLNTCHPELRRLFVEVVKQCDCSVEGGVRTMAEQEANVAKGVSKTLESKHLLEYSSEPAEGCDAVDVAPYPVQWPTRPADASAAELNRYMREVARFYWFAGYVKRVAEQMGVKVRWGGDWDGDGDFKDQQFDDLDHWERVTP